MPRPEGRDSTVESRPSWQTDACPPWCVGGHGELDHPDDRVHRSRSVVVPVVARHTWFEGALLRRSADAVDFDVAISQVDGESDIWLYVGAGPAASIEVTLESAERLVRAIGEVAALGRDS